MLSFIFPQLFFLFPLNFFSNNLSGYQAKTIEGNWAWRSREQKMERPSWRCRLACRASRGRSSQSATRPPLQARKTANADTPGRYELFNGIKNAYLNKLRKKIRNYFSNSSVDDFEEKLAILSLLESYRWLWPQKWLWEVLGSIIVIYLISRIFFGFEDNPVPKKSHRQKKHIS